MADKVEGYNIELKGVLDKHAPEKTKIVKITHQNPWFNDKIKEEIRVRRKKEHGTRIQLSTTFRPSTTKGGM